MDIQEQIEETMDKGGVRVRTIVEIAGKPKEHVEKTLITYVKKMRDDEHIIVANETKYKAEEQDNGFFNAFAELELVLPNVREVTSFCFDYMPSSIEVLEPSKLIFETNDLGNYLNDLMARLHQLDMLVKNLRAENTLLSKNAQTLVKNLILNSLAKKPMNSEDFSQYVGIAPEKLENFLESLLKEGKVRKESTIFHLNKKK